jgi:hypothetical protein
MIPAQSTDPYEHRSSQHIRLETILRSLSKEELLNILDKHEIRMDRPAEATAEKLGNDSNI